MKTQMRQWCAFSIALCLMGPAAAQPPDTAGRDWTINDSIAVRYFVREGNEASYSSVKQNPIVSSPDGNHFFVVSRHGDLERDCNVYQLQVFSVAAVHRAFANDLRDLPGTPKPVVTATLCSGSSYWSGMADVTWMDSSTITFAGQEGGDAHNIYELDIRSGVLRKLTDAPKGVDGATNGIMMNYAVNGGSVVYLAPVSIPADKGFLRDYPALTITSTDKVILPRLDVTIGLYASYKGEGSYLIDPTGESRIVSVSPNGKWAILLMPTQDPTQREKWAAYAGPNPEKSLQFVLWNLQSKSGRPLFDAPSGQAVTDFDPSRTVLVIDNPWPRLAPMKALWSTDSSRVVVVNTALPLDSEIPGRRRMSYLVDYDIPTGRWEVIEPVADFKKGRRVGQVEWIIPGKQLIVTHLRVPKESLTYSNYNKGAEGTIYSLKAGKWIRREVASSVTPPITGPYGSADDAVFSGGLSINVRENANEPPVIVASLRGRQIALSEPDPALRDVWRAEARPIKWTEPDGLLARGLLLLPRKPDHARPAPPLVIQAYWQKPELFRPDGTASTAYAAQPLVAQGFAVLFIDMPAADRRETVDTPREGEAMVTRIDSAVLYLAQQGLIDPNRVGLIGFSRSGYLAYYAVTHPGKIILGAAVSADGVTYTLSGQVAEYTRWADRGPRRALDTDELMYGGSIKDATSAWMKHDPSLNTHCARTPTLFAYNGRSSFLMSASTLGAMRVGGCPAEFILFPEGSHQLVRPRERNASLSASIDWMKFWLLGLEDRRAEKAETYIRWRKMRSGLKLRSDSDIPQ